MDCVDVVIAAFLWFHVLAGLHYYVLNTDPLDEAYAWRMFSVTSRSASVNKWTRFDNTVHVGQNGTLITRLDVARLNVPTHWVNMIMGEGKPGILGTPKWVLERFAVRLCVLLPGHVEAVSVQRIVLPMYGEPEYEGVIQWDCF